MLLHICFESFLGHCLTCSLFPVPRLCRGCATARPAHTNQSMSTNMLLSALVQASALQSAAQLQLCHFQTIWGRAYLSEVLHRFSILVCRAICMLWGVLLVVGHDPQLSCHPIQSLAGCWGQLNSPVGGTHWCTDT